MLRSKLLLPTFNRSAAMFRTSFSSKATDKVLGYQEKPNEFEITADYIGKHRIRINEKAKSNLM